MTVKRPVYGVIPGGAMTAKRTILALPPHKNPSRQREASAPYNFVPLPEVVVTAVARPAELPRHDTYADPQYPHTGYFAVRLTTLTPLYVRGPMTTAQYRRRERGQEPPEFRRQVKNRPGFFYTANPAHPIIPGSSLRGMLRSVLEIAGYGKIRRVTRKNLFYRSLGDPALKDLYQSHFIAKGETVSSGGDPSARLWESRVRAGFLRRDNRGQYWIDECPFGRIEREPRPRQHSAAVLAQVFPGTPLYVDPRPRPRPSQNAPAPRVTANWTPNWEVQYATVYATLDPEADHFFPAQFRPDGQPIHEDLYLRFRAVSRLSRQPYDGGKKATLVLTGHMERKHLEYVFVHETLRSLRLDATKVEQFDDDDQITRWQEDAFPVDKPSPPARQRPGLLRETGQCSDEPVFFLVEENDENAVRFFGRAQMFRLPYEHAPFDLIPAPLRQEDDIDYADALFGYVREADHQQGTPEQAYAGRVTVTDAVWDRTTPLPAGRQSPYLTAPNGSALVLVPPIQGEPKPTAFQQYLTQPDPHNRANLKHYDATGTTLRGFKRYWHQEGVNVAALHNGAPPERSTQHTQLTPVGDGVHFDFRVYFENLSDAELGALYWVLQPQGDPRQTYRHKLGMGKAFGFGSVRLEVTPHITSRASRYRALFAENSAGTTWHDGDPDPVDLHQCAHRFEGDILKVLGMEGKATRLYEMERIAMLLRLMEYPGIAARPATEENPYNRHANARPMAIELKDAQGQFIYKPGRGRRKINEFAERPVLPDPSQFDRPLIGPRLHPEPTEDPPTDERAAAAGNVVARGADEGAAAQEDDVNGQAQVATETETLLTQLPITPPATPQIRAVRRNQKLKAVIEDISTKKGTLMLKVSLPDTGDERLFSIPVSVGYRQRYKFQPTIGQIIDVAVKSLDSMGRIDDLDLV